MVLCLRSYGKALPSFTCPEGVTSQRFVFKVILATVLAPAYTVTLRTQRLYQVLSSNMSIRHQGVGHMTSGC